MLKTAVIQIGNSDDKLTQAEWGRFVLDSHSLIEANCKNIHFFGGSIIFSPWQNAALIFEIESDKVQGLKKDLSELAKKYNQDSIAWQIGETEFIKAS